MISLILQGFTQISSEIILNPTLPGNLIFTNEQLTALRSRIRLHRLEYFRKRLLSTDFHTVCRTKDPCK